MDEMVTSNQEVIDEAVTSKEDHKMRVFCSSSQD